MQQAMIKIKGLWTKSNPINAPEGTQAVANNVVIDANDEARPRRGMFKYGSVFTLGSGEKMRNCFEFNSKLHIIYGTKLAYDTDGAGTWADYGGTYDTLVTDNGVGTAVYDDTLYLATSAGVYRTDAAGTDPVLAGLPRALPIRAVLVIPATGTSSGFFSTNTQVCYRVIYTREDANKRLLESVPSGRAVIINSAGARDVTLTVPLASGIIAGDKIAVYRSLISGGVGVEPADDLYLAKEYKLVAGDITAGSVSITDDVRQDALGGRLYTSDQGVDQSNFRPPVCADVVTFRDHAFYVRTRQPHRMILRLQKVLKSSVSPGLTAADTVVIAGVTYTADATEGNENAATGVFWVDTASTDARARIMNTCMSLCRVINGIATNTTVYAYYEGEYASDPGVIVIERRDFTNTAFYATAGSAGAGAAFAPVLPTTGTTIASDAQERKNGLYVSKPWQPDAVPLGNELLIGDEGEEIVKAVSCRSALWIFTVSGKVYRVTGSDMSTWSSSLFDASTKIWGPKTAVSVESGVVLFTTRGTVLCTDSGIKEVGDPIDDKTAGFISLSTYPNFKRDAFAVNYASDKCYLLFHSSTVYCWCYDTNAWTTWTLECDAGCIMAVDDRLYTTRDDGYVRKERKAGTRFDYTDQSYAVTVVSRSSYDVVLSSVSGLSVGQGMYQTDTRWGVITAIDTGTATVTMDRISGWQAGAATAHDPITCELTWNPITAGKPGGLKRNKEVAFFWSHSDGSYTARVATNFDGTYTEATVTPIYKTSTWGGFPWGEEPWGGSQGGESANRMLFPPSKIRALWTYVGVKCTQPWSAFKLSGFCLTFDSTGSKYNERLSA